LESSIRDCYAIEITYLDCTTYSGSTGTETWSFTACGDPYTETTVGCDGGTPTGGGGAGGSGWNPIGDDGEDPRPIPIGDGGDTVSVVYLTTYDVLCEKYPLNCDCIRNLEGTTDGRKITQLFVDYENVIDPCYPNKDVVANAISQNCFENGGNMDLTSLENAFTSPDHIDFGALKDDCPCLYDYFTNLTTVGNDNWLCGMLKEMESVDKDLFLQNFKLTDGDKFRTIANWSAGTATMLVPKSACNGQQSNPGFPDIDPNSLIGGQFIHEFLHSYLVKIWSESNEGPLPNDFYIWTTDEDGVTTGLPNTDYYIDLVESFADGEVLTGDQHVLFFTHLKKLIIGSLHSLNGGLGDPSDYEYYFHLLVNTPNLVNEHPNFAEAMGFVDEFGNGKFDISKYLGTWKNIGGAENGAHLLFDPNCN
jgi:hypothetical protein